MSRDHHDFLIDQLLRELLGGDRPRDMTARVLARARVVDSSRRRCWISSAAALAASIAVIAALVLFWPRQYHVVRVVEGTLSPNTPVIDRGTTLETGDEPASLELGGYAQVTMGPDTALTLGGVKFHERIILDQGNVAVSVQPRRGAFEVAAGPAMVRVVGTRFNVNLAVERDDARSEWVKRLKVDVTEGTVEVSGVDRGIARLAAGQTQEFTLTTQRIMQAGPSAPALVQASSVAPQRASASPADSPDRPATMTPQTRGNSTGRQGAVVRPQLAATESGPARPPLFKPIRVIVGRDRVQIQGIVRRNAETNLYVLDTPSGWVFLSATPTPAIRGLLDKSARVVWDDGRIISATPVPSP